MKPAYVWDVSQTSGDPIPERPMPVLLEGKAPTRIEGEVGTFQELPGGNDTQIAATYSAENVGPR